MRRRLFFLFCCLTFCYTLNAQYRTNLYTISCVVALSNDASNPNLQDAERMNLFFISCWKGYWAIAGFVVLILSVQWMWIIWFKRRELRKRQQFILEYMKQKNQECEKATFNPEEEELLTRRQNVKNRFLTPHTLSSGSDDMKDPFFQKLLAYIDQNMGDEKLSADKLCEQLGVSKSSLYIKVKSVLGITPHGLISQRRIMEASLLLGSTTLTVSEIIIQTGFHSRAHFYEIFHKTYGCSPLEYRQQRSAQI